MRIEDARVTNDADVALDRIMLNRYFPSWDNVIGDILCVGKKYVLFVGETGVMWRNGSPPERVVLAIHPRYLNYRGGVKISKLSGRPGTDGYVAFARIARSWGYD